MLGVTCQLYILGVIILNVVMLSVVALLKHLAQILRQDNVGRI